MLVLSQAAESAGEQFEEQPLVEAEIRSVIGSTYKFLGKDNEAEPHLVEAMAIRRRVLGDEHPRQRSTRSATWATCSCSQGKYDEAMPYHLEALETRRRVLGDEHPDTLDSIGNMGNLLLRQGKYDEAEAVLRGGAGNATPRPGRRASRHAHLDQQHGQPALQGKASTTRRCPTPWRPWKHKATCAASWAMSIPARSTRSTTWAACSNKARQVRRGNAVLRGGDGNTSPRPGR